MIKRTALFFLTMSLTLSAVAAASPGDGTPGDAKSSDVKSVLEKVIAWEESMPPVSMDLEVSGVQDLPTEASDMRFKLHCWRDGERADYVGDDYSTENGVDVHTCTRRAIWDGTHYLTREVKSPDKPLDERPMAFYGIGKFANQLTYRPWTAPYLDGRFDDDGTMVGKHMLAAGNAVLLAPEVIDGISCNVVVLKTEAKGELVIETIWVDPLHSYALRQVTRHTEKDGHIFDVKLAEIELTHIGDADIISKARLTSKEVENKQTTYKYDGTAVRKNIKLKPDFAKEGAFIMEGIPEGAPVFDVEKFGQPENAEPSLVWKQGQAVGKG